MSRGEASVVARIACNADGGCPVCARDLIDALKRAFPEHADLIERAYTDEFGEDDE